MRDFEGDFFFEKCYVQMLKQTPIFTLLLIGPRQPHFKSFRWLPVL